MYLTRNSLFAALACSALSCTALAQGTGGDRGWYAGIDLGQSKLEQNAPVPAVVNRDDTSSAWGIRAGYRFVEYFALEAGYADLGDFETTYVPLCAITPPSACPSAVAGTSIDGFTLTAVGTWPVARHFHLKGTLGGIYRELEATIRDNNYTGSGGWSETNTAFSYGIGIAVPVNAHFEIDLDYTWYREIGLGLNLDNNVLVVDESESSVAMLGVRYSF